MQNINGTDPAGRSFDEIMGEQAGALRSKHAGVVEAVEPGRIAIKDAEGRVHEHELYDHLPFNGKSVTGDAVVGRRRAGDGSGCGGHQGGQEVGAAGALGRLGVFRVDPQDRGQ